MKKLVGNVVLALALVAIVSGTAFAQPGGGRPGGGGNRGFGGGFGGGGGNLDILMRADVGKEIELLDDQKEELKEIQDGMRERMREVFATFRDMSDEERREAMTDFQKGIQEDVDGVLLPHQSKRIKQIALQRRMSGGASRALGGDVAEELGLSEKDLEEIREKAQAAAADLQKKIDAIRKEAQDELLNELLTAAQLKQLKDMVGEKFEFDASEQQNRFGAFGGQGGRGQGGRGQGGRGGAPGGRQRPASE